MNADKVLWKDVAKALDIPCYHPATNARAKDYHVKPCVFIVRQNEMIRQLVQRGRQDSEDLDEIIQLLCDAINQMTDGLRCEQVVLKTADTATLIQECAIKPTTLEEKECMSNASVPEEEKTLSKSSVLLKAQPSESVSLGSTPTIVEVSGIKESQLSGASVDSQEDLDEEIQNACAFPVMEVSNEGSLQLQTPPADVDELSVVKQDKMIVPDVPDDQDDNDDLEFYKEERRRLGCPIQ